MTVKRRDVLKRIVAGGAGLATIRLPSLMAQTPSVRIGLLTVTSGPLAEGGYQMNQGIDAFLKEMNNTLGGRKVELLVADTGGNPQTAKTKLMELVERDHVDIVVGPFAAFELLAISGYIREKQIPLITTATAEDITQRATNPWIVRTSSSSGQAPHAMADYCVKELKLKKMATIANDFAFGHEQCAGFQRVFEDEGGKIVQKLWPPLVTPDFLPYIAQFEDIDGIFNGLGGGNPIRFLKTYESVGAKVTMTGGWSLIDEPLLKSFGDEAVGVYTAHWYTPSFDSPSNKRFVATMRDDFHELPGGGAAGTYVAGQVIDAALKKTGGNIEDKTSFMDAIRTIDLSDTPRGRFRFDKYGNAVGPIFIRKCERRDGRLVNTVVKTYSDVSQFWTYDPDEFLSKPVYSRDYPPLKP